MLSTVDFYPIMKVLRNFNLIDVMKIRFPFFPSVILLFMIYLTTSLSFTINHYQNRIQSSCSLQKRSFFLSMITNPSANSQRTSDYLQSSIVDDITGLTNARGLRPTLLENVETDYLGMIDFCLKANDNALSGPSRSKVLNALTNEIFKALIIGYDPLIERVYNNLDEYKTKITESECLPIEDFEPQKSNETEEEMMTRYQLCEIKQKDDLKKALEYVARLEKLITNGEINEDVLGSYVYDRGYKGLLTALRDSGCKFPGSFSNNKDSVRRPYPTDKNICLSILDLKLPKNPQHPSKTYELNKLSNLVSRAILYGGKYEKDILISTIEQRIPEFCSKWKLENGIDSQEIRYLKALILLLQVGISKAEEAVTSIDFPITTTTTTTTANVNANVDVSGASSSSSSGSTSTVSYSLRLFDSYLNAFHRVVEVCLSEISTRLSRDMNPQNDDFLLNFVQWEQSLRRNLTADLWKQNPTELVGTWEFVDVKGDGGLRSLLINSETYFEGESLAVAQGERPVLSVELTRDGKVNVKAGARSTVIGREWFFKPGPAHLDTCEFYVSSETDDDMLLRYVGFIDRGQRIESRFSKSPIRMTGRVLTIVKGELIGSCRFIMVLRR